MTLEQARKENLDVYMLPNTPRGVELRNNLVQVFTGREQHEFETELKTFEGNVTVLCFAVKRRAGIIAPHMKKKTVRGFIQEE